MDNIWIAWIVLAVPALAGCGNSEGQFGPPVPATAEVQVSLPVTREVTDYEDFPGRTEAVHSIDVRARVTGYLDKVLFRDGADVKQGELLFEIDPRPYKAQLDQDQADLVNKKAVVAKTEAMLQRTTALLRTRASTQEDIDNQKSDWEVAKAAVGQAQARIRAAQLNLDWTRVTSSINGRISRRYIDPGNLVKADETVLTTIVSLDPMYASFNVDERTALRLQRLVREGKIKWSPEVGIPIFLGLADEEGFSRRGMINFADNRVDPDTGTWRLRGRFDNHDYALSPGLFVRLRAPIGSPYEALLVAEEALGTDQGQKFVYVVDDAGRVVYRRVKVGRLHDGLRVISDGLAPGDKVVVNGLQRVRPGIEVEPEVVPMPVGQRSEVRSQKSEETSLAGNSRCPALPHP